MSPEFQGSCLSAEHVFCSFGCYGLSSSNSQRSYSQRSSSWHFTAWLVEQFCCFSVVARFPFPYRFVITTIEVVVSLDM